MHVVDGLRGYDAVHLAGALMIGAAVLMLLAFPRTRSIWRDGAIAGSWLLAGFAFQTAGLVTTGASNSALITGLYVVFNDIKGYDGFAGAQPDRSLIVKYSYLFDVLR